MIFNPRLFRCVSPHQSSPLPVGQGLANSPLDATVDGPFQLVLFMFANLRDKLTSSFRGGGVTKEDTLLIERAKEIIDKKIRVDGKSSLRYEDVQAKLVLEFSKRSFEKHLA